MPSPIKFAEAVPRFSRELNAWAAGLKGEREREGSKLALSEEQPPVFVDTGTSAANRPHPAKRLTCEQGRHFWAYLVARASDIGRDQSVCLPNRFRHRFHFQENANRFQNGIT